MTMKQALAALGGEDAARGFHDNPRALSELTNKGADSLRDAGTRFGVGVR